MRDRGSDFRRHGVSGDHGPQYGVGSRELDVNPPHGDLVPYLSVDEVVGPREHPEEGWFRSLRPARE
jgi:hypothetical protein